jgi:transketolase
MRVAIETRNRPVALVLTRQEVPVLDRTRYGAAEGLRRGAYILEDATGGKPDLILMASGSEAALIVSAQQKLAERGIAVRTVSMPSWELFDAQPADYRNAILPPSTRARLAVEAGVSQGWRKYVGDRGDMISLDRFGASAPSKVVLEKLGYTVDNVVARAAALLHK